MQPDTEIGQKGTFCKGLAKLSTKARSSGGERYLDTVEVGSSNLLVPTIKNKGLRATKLVSPFLMRLGCVGDLTWRSEDPAQRG